MGDVAATVRFAMGTQAPGAVRFVGYPEALARLGFRASRKLALLASDAVEPALRPACAWGRPAHTFRIWWNRPDEVEAYLSSPRGASSKSVETHVCFFPEISAAVSSLGLDVITTSYAFSWPTELGRVGRREERPPGATADAIFYVGELDVSDACFTGLLGATETRTRSDGVWDLAHSVVDGNLSLVASDDQLATDGGGPELHQAALWALRNRTRFLLLRRLADTFPDRVLLRGSDLAKAGFGASRTRFNRNELLAEYARCRVSLDLGSKSTHAGLYPRSADILSVGGGLVQFDSGVNNPRWRAPIATDRLADSADRLVDAVDRLLSRPTSEVVDANGAMREQYRALRHQAGADLLAGISSVLARSMTTGRDVD